MLCIAQFFPKWQFDWLAPEFHRVLIKVSKVYITSLLSLYPVLTDFGQELDFVNEARNSERAATNNTVKGVYFPTVDWYHILLQS